VSENEEGDAPKTIPTESNLKADSDVSRPDTKNVKAHLDALADIATIA
jgi:hypothetical protein